MKRKNFFMLALAAVAFAACSNEDLVPVDNPGNNNDLVTDPNAPQISVILQKWLRPSFLPEIRPVKDGF